MRERVMHIHQIHPEKRVHTFEYSSIARLITYTLMEVRNSDLYRTLCKTLIHTHMERWNWPCIAWTVLEEKPVAEVTSMALTI